MKCNIKQSKQLKKLKKWTFNMKSGCKDNKSKLKKHVGCIIDSQNKEGGWTKIEK